MRTWGSVALIGLVVGCGDGAPVVVGSKDFVEQEVLAELISQELEEAGIPVERRFHFGGTNLTHTALKNGEIDVYPEYTGTMLTAVLGMEPGGDAEQVFTTVEEAYLERWDLVVGRSFGFENTFALIVRSSDADSLGLETIADLADHAEAMTAGFGPEFRSRPDGYAAVRETYGFEFGSVRQMDLGLLYRALSDGGIDVAVGNSTDGQILAFDLVVLEDDRGAFPPYQAVPVVRRQTLERYPGVWDVLQSLVDVLDEEAMRGLNANVVVEGTDVPRAVRRWRATRIDAASDTTAVVPDLQMDETTQSATEQ